MDSSVAKSVSLNSRSVVASDLVVMGPNDLEAAVVLDDLTFLFTVVSGGEPAVLKSDVVTPKILRFSIVGKLPFGGGVWNLSNVATFRSKSLHLTFHVIAFGETGPSHILSYTFSQPEIT